MINRDAYYTTEEVAIELRIERRRVREAIAKGELAALDVGAGSVPRWRILGADLLTWGERRRTGQATAPTNG